MTTLWNDVALHARDENFTRDDSKMNTFFFKSLNKPAQASSIVARSQQHNNDRKHDSFCSFFLLARVEEPLTKDNQVFKSLSQSR